MDDKVVCCNCEQSKPRDQVDLFEAEIMDLDGMMVDVWMCKSCQGGSEWIFSHGGECKECHRPEMTELNADDYCSECFEAKYGNNN